MTLRHILRTITLLASLSWATAAMAEISFAGGDGRSMQTAILIVGASCESDGVDSEYAWVAANRPGATVQGQALLQDGDRVFDQLNLLVDGTPETVFFDITDFFGKF